MQTPKGPGVQDEGIIAKRRFPTCDDAIVACSDPALAGFADASIQCMTRPRKVHACAARPYERNCDNAAPSQKAAMSLLSRLLAVFRPVQLPEVPQALPHGKQRIHLFSGNFEDADAAMAYCFHALGDVPEQITLDQPGAFIDTSYVEVDFGTAEKRLTEFLGDEQANHTFHKMRGANTLIIMTEQAFGGFPYVLTHTPNLFYLGPYIVDV